MPIYQYNSPVFGLMEGCMHDDISRRATSPHDNSAYNGKSAWSSNTYVPQHVQYPSAKQLTISARTGPLCVSLLLCHRTDNSLAGPRAGRILSCVMVDLLQQFTGDNIPRIYETILGAAKYNTIFGSKCGSDTICGVDVICVFVGLE